MTSVYKCPAFINLLGTLRNLPGIITLRIMCFMIDVNYVA